MSKMILCAVALMCLCWTEDSKACTQRNRTDLSWAPILPGSLKLPLNGKIYSVDDIELFGEDGSKIETVAQPIPNRDGFKLNEHAPKNGFLPGIKVTGQSKGRADRRTVVITSDLDTQAPAVPSLTIGTVSYEIKISGDGLFYIIEDESGPLTATSSYYLGWGTPKKYRAIAVDEAGNRSAPSEWIIASGELKNDCPVTTMPGSFGCSSTGEEAAFGALIAYAFLRLRRKKDIRENV